MPKLNGTGRENRSTKVTIPKWVLTQNDWQSGDDLNLNFSLAIAVSPNGDVKRGGSYMEIRSMTNEIASLVVRDDLSYLIRKRIVDLAQGIWALVNQESV